MRFLYCTSVLWEYIFWCILHRSHIWSYFLACPLDKMWSSSLYGCQSSIILHAVYVFPSGYNYSIVHRSCPRPPVELIGKAMQQSVPGSSKHYPVEAQKPSNSGHSRHGSQFAVPEPSAAARPEVATQNIDSSNGFLRRSTSRNVLPVTQTYVENIRHEFSDATSSDWSLFTSSDEASFTTESTRDSFSTVDYGDNMDPFTSIFNYTAKNSYRKFSISRPLTRFFPEKGHTERVQRIDKSNKTIHSSIEHPPNGNCGMYVYYGSNPVCDIIRTSSQCEL